MIWIADITAYFVGKRYGNTKLLEQISPGKTVEGAYGALAATALLATGVGFWAKLEPVQIADFVFLSVITVAVSILGDLFESFVKRLRGVKDSSGILPGHGGVLDRNDSLIAAVSVFYAGSFLLGIFLNTGSVTQDNIVLDPSSPDAVEMQLDDGEMSEDEATEETHDHDAATPDDHDHPGKP
jgi:phosphatidate cytidylyltransferase